MGRSDLTIPMHYYHLLSLIVCLGSCAAKSVTKTYLVETNDGELNYEPEPKFEPEPKPEEFGDDYGHHGNLWTPRLYGQPTTQPETVTVTCTWDNWGAWSGTSATCASGSCGGGSSTESTQVNNGPCYTCSMGPWSMW